MYESESKWKLFLWFPKVSVGKSKAKVKQKPKKNRSSWIVQSHDPPNLQLVQLAMKTVIPRQQQNTMLNFNDVTAS